MKNSPKFRRILLAQSSLGVIGFFLLLYPIHVRTIQEIMEWDAEPQVNEDCDPDSFQWGQYWPLECGNRLDKVL